MRDNQYVIPKKLRTDVIAAVKWKWPVTQMVLWINAFIWWDALIIPPAPPGMKATIPMKGAKKRTSFHGSFLNQPNSVVYPFLRPVASNVAKIENAVIRVGMITINVRTT